MLETQMDTQQLNDLIDGLVRGEYNLLFGAGASIGARGKDGSKLPDADTLSKELLLDFSVETGGYKLDLKSAYEQVEGLKDSKNRNRDEYFSSRFSKCDPTWQVMLPKFRWNRIWSLNIDDVVEGAYGLPQNSKQVAKPIDWTDLYCEPDRNKDELQIIHLHGFAPYIPSGKSKLVFSILEYLQATSQLHAWHRIFGDEFLQRPFIVIGAKLNDEYDLADVIRRGNNSKDFSGRPSLIVLKEIPPFMKDNFKKWGLIPIEATGEEFIRTMLPKVEVRERESFEFSGGVTKESLHFFSQFRWLKVEDTVSIEKNRDFYLGDDPEWNDIVQDKDAVFDICRKVLQPIFEEFNEKEINKQKIYCISGSPGSGKSAAALRIGRELIKSGYDVFLFKPESRVNIKSVLWCLKTFRKPVFLFDNIADFSDDVGNLAIEASKSKVNLLVISTERDQRMQQVYQGILPEFLMSNNLNCDRMSDGDIQKLIKKLESYKRLGKITRYSTHERIRYFRKYANRQLLVGMSELEGGKGFPKRIKSEYDSIPGIYKRIYDLSCVTYSLGYELPLAIACAATGAVSADVNSSLKGGGALAGVMLSDGSGLKPRHRVVASLVIEKVLSKQDRYDVALLLTKTLSPYITPRTISQRTIPYRIVRRIMDADLIYEWVGSQRAREFYESLVLNYSWNARFWEQRALLESRLGHFPRARSYAEEAVRIQKHAFTLNTLGSILTKMAIDYLSPDSKEGYDLFFEGLKCLEEARDTRDDETIHTYATFFNRTLSYARLVYQDKGDPVDDKLKSEWNSWMKHASRSPVYSHFDYKNQLSELQRNWLMLAVTKTQGAAL